AHLEDFEQRSDDEREQRHDDRNGQANYRDPVRIDLRNEPRSACSEACHSVASRSRWMAWAGMRTASPVPALRSVRLPRSSSTRCLSSTLSVMRVKLPRKTHFSM